MDDLEFRRNIFADPKSRDEALLNAKRVDPAKQQLSSELNALDEQIAHALNVPVPENLSNKLILRQTLQQHQQSKRKKRTHLALAASVAITVGVLVNSFLFTSAYSTLGEHAIAHMEHESFSNDSENVVSLATLNDKMADFNGYFNAIAGKLISAEFCWFDGIRSLHLVYQGEHSPITVFIVPENNDLKVTSKFSNDTLEGRVIPFKKNNVIVVADKNEPIDTWQQKVASDIKWQT